MTPPPAPVVTPVPTSAVGPSLPALGFAHGPSSLTLPPEVVMSGRIDQENVVGAFGPPQDSSMVLAYLTDVLPSQGWTVTARGGGSLLFSAPGWDGAFTSGPQQWALVVRSV